MRSHASAVHIWCAKSLGVCSYVEILSERKISIDLAVYKVMVSCEDFGEKDASTSENGG